MVELKLLHAFAVLCEELHFGRAAARLHIVQPALSAQIKALETELECELFYRNRRSVVLSESGRVFLPGALATLEQAKKSVDKIHAIQHGSIGRIRIGIVSSLLPWYLPRLVRQLHAEHPGIELDLKDMPSTDQISLLTDGILDFAFLRLPISTRLLKTVPLFDEDFIVALPLGHHLAQHQVLKPKDLADISCFMLGRRFAPGFHDALCLAFASQGVILKIEREFGEFPTMAAFVGAGMGVGIMPRLTLPLPPSDVTIRPLDLEGHRSTIGIVYQHSETPLEKVFLSAALKARHNPGL